MATLTADQLLDMQADLGISNDGAVFSDAELNRLYTRADGDYNTAVYLAWRQLMADASKFFDYTAGETEIKKSQVRKHIGEVVTFWKSEARQVGNQVRLVGLNEIPPRWKDAPDLPTTQGKRRPSDAVD